MAFARERVGFKAPEQIGFIAELPISAGGKIDRVRLKQMASTSTDGRTNP